MTFLGELLQLHTFGGRYNPLFSKYRITLLKQIKIDKKLYIIEAFVKYL